MKRWLVAYGILIACVWLVYHEWVRLPNGQLNVAVMDVGQGDAILITTPGNQRVLVDGGPDLSLLERLGEELPFFERTIDLLVLTHPDRDHITALPEVLHRYTVQRVLLTGVQHDSSAYFAFLDAVRESGAQVIIAESGYDIDLGRNLFLDIVWPVKNKFGNTVKRTNNESIVAKLIWKDHSILLTGDIEQKTEEALLATGVDLRSDVLKVPHHGSKTSSSTGFLLAVGPGVAFVSAGKGNHFGHPHESVLTRYHSLGIPVHSTTTENTIRMRFP